MKKIFAGVLCVLIFMLSGYTVQAKDTSFEQDTSQASFEDVETKEANVEDGKLTLELLDQIESWEELIKTGLPISYGDRANIGNKEDRYCVMLLETLNEKNTENVYHNQEYVSVGLGGIKLEEINYDRLLKKYQRIIDIYNESNNLHLVWEVKPLSFNCIQVDIESTNLIELSNTATMVGQKVILKPGTRYWESPLNDGSGEYGEVNKNNIYIPKDGVVIVNGFVYYKDDTRKKIVESYYKPYNELKNNECNIVLWNYRMIHICTETMDLGWIYPENVIRARTCK